MIVVNVDSQETDPPPIPQDHIHALIRAVTQDHDIANGNIQLVFTTDEALAEMKLKYFGTDAYTDIIAFNLNEEDEALEGELYISAERAKENAAEYGETHLEELRRLVIHGMLHLLGYDDQTDKDQAAMRELENQFLSRIPAPEVM